MNNLTAIVPFREGHTTIGRLLDSLPSDLSVIVVDDVSAQPFTTERPNVRVMRLSRRSYFSGAVNAGITACTTDVLVLNQDAWLEGDAWQTFIADHRDAAIAGNEVTGHPAWPRGYVDGVFMYLSRKAINAVGLLDERDYPLWGNSALWQAMACRKGFTAAPAAVPGLMHDRNGRHGASIAEFVKIDPEHADWAKRTPPMVSVIMACYNYGRYLPDAINSLRGGQTSLGQHSGQTFQSFEVLIVDDCSKDETPQIAQDLADAWQGIRYIRLPHNVGTAGAYNAGIKAGYGRYFMMLSADDMLEPDALERMYRIVEDDDHAIAYTDLQLFRDGVRGKSWPMQEYDFELLLERNHVPAGIMAAKTAWKAVGGYPEAFRFGREDWAMAVALGRAGYCGVRVPEPLYLYRRAGQNRSATNGTAEWRLHFVTQMRETFPDLYRGERPMGCCGGTKRPARTVQAPQGVRTMAMRGMRAGEDGMTLLEYVGTNDGKTSWFGPVTGTRYEFGKSRPVGYVDDRDVTGLLETVQGRRPVFRRYVQPAPVVVKMAEPIIEPTPIYEAPIVVEPIIEATVLQVAPEIVAVAKPKRTRKAKRV